MSLGICWKVGEGMWEGPLSGGAAGEQEGQGLRDPHPARAPGLTLTHTGYVIWGKLFSL